MENNGKKKVSHVDGDPYSNLTKREYFAAMAMQGLCAGRTEYEQPGTDAKIAVEMADELLNELEKKDVKYGIVNAIKNLNLSSITSFDEPIIHQLFDHDDRPLEGDFAIVINIKECPDENQ